MNDSHRTVGRVIRFRKIYQTVVMLPILDLDGKRERGPSERTNDTDFEKIIGGISDGYGPMAETIPAKPIFLLLVTTFRGSLAISGMMPTASTRGFRNRGVFPNCRRCAHAMQRAEQQRKNQNGGEKYGVYHKCILRYPR